MAGVVLDVEPSHSTVTVVLCSNDDLVAGAAGTWKLTFRDRNRDLIDPDEILVVHRDPAGAEVSYTDASSEVFQDSPEVVGVWWFTSPVLVAGKHRIYFRGDAAAEAIEFTVRPDGTTTV